MLLQTEAIKVLASMLGRLVACGCLDQLLDLLWEQVLGESDSGEVSQLWQCNAMRLGTFRCWHQIGYHIKAIT